MFMVFTFPCQTSILLYIIIIFDFLRSLGLFSVYFFLGVSTIIILFRGFPSCGGVGVEWAVFCHFQTQVNSTQSTHRF